MVNYKIRNFVLMLLLIFWVINVGNVFAQQDRRVKDQYMLSDEQQAKLQIVVHIWGEINQPGQHVVPDGTNALELISLAGGPTQFSNLSNVTLTREATYRSKSGILSKKKVIVRMNLNKHLNKMQPERIYVLKPGDVVQVNRNSWFNLEKILRILTQIAIIVQGLYFTGIINNN